MLPVVSLSETGSPFAENGGTATVTATLNGTSSQTVTIPLNFGGTASAADYKASAASITVAAGKTTGSITLTGSSNPSFGTSPQTVTVSLGSLTNGTPGSPSSVTVKIECADFAPRGDLARRHRGGLLTTAIPLPPSAAPARPTPSPSPPVPCPAA